MASLTLPCRRSWKPSSLMYSVFSESCCTERSTRVYVCCRTRAFLPHCQQTLIYFILFYWDWTFNNKPWISHIISDLIRSSHQMMQDVDHTNFILFAENWLKKDTVFVTNNFVKAEKPTINQELVSQLVISEIIFTHTGIVFYTLKYQTNVIILIKNNTSTHYSAEDLGHVVV